MIKIEITKNNKTISKIFQNDLSEDWVKAVAKNHKVDKTKIKIIFVLCIPMIFICQFSSLFTMFMIVYRCLCGLRQAILCIDLLQRIILLITLHAPRSLNIVAVIPVQIILQQLR